ncbi:hypothetical protein BH09SUM1_BH09SUM1_11330 [soil metagenome]
MPLDASVIIPCYNSERYLRETVESVLAQKGVRFEIILVEDGSTDSTAAMLDEFAARDPRIITIRQPNAGVAAARNTGLRKARGEFISMLDSDDLLAPDKLRRQIVFLRGHPEYVGVSGNHERIDETGKTTLTELSREREIALGEMLLGNAVHISAVTLRRSVLADYGFMDEGVVPADDWEYFARIVIMGGRLFHQKAMVSKYRVAGGSLSSNAARMTNACLRIVEKNFANPALIPADLKLKPRAEKLVRAVGFCRAILTRDEAEARSQAAAIARLDPAFFSAGAPELVDTLAGWMMFSASENKPIGDAAAQAVAEFDRDGKFAGSLHYALEKQRVTQLKRSGRFYLLALAALALRFPARVMHSLLQRFAGH